MVEPLDHGEITTIEFDLNQENFINKNGENNENFTKTKMFEEFFQWPGDVTIIGNQFEFQVHAVIIINACNTLKIFLNQPCLKTHSPQHHQMRPYSPNFPPCSTPSPISSPIPDYGSSHHHQNYSSQKKTSSPPHNNRRNRAPAFSSPPPCKNILLPKHIHVNTAIEFFKTLYFSFSGNNKVRESVKPNLRKLNISELTHYYELSDMFLLEEGKIVFANHMKEAIENAVCSFFGGAEVNHVDQKFLRHLIHSNEKVARLLDSLFQLAFFTNCELCFDLLDDLFFIYLEIQTLKNPEDSFATIKMFQYVAKQRPETHESRLWGGQFFFTVLDFANKNRLSWRRLGVEFHTPTNDALLKFEEEIWLDLEKNRKLLGELFSSTFHFSFHEKRKC